MKKTLLALSVAWLFTYLLPAQGPGDYQFQFQFANTLDEWVKGPDGAWFGAGWSVSHPGWPLGVPFVVKWDMAKDSILWKKAVPMPLSEFVWDVALLPAPDGGVYVGAVFDGCDYPTPDGLARLDAGGNILWTIQSPDDLRESNSLWLLPTANSNLLFQTDSYQLEIDPNGALKWAQKEWFGWNGIARRREGDYLFYGYGKLGVSNLVAGIVELPFADNIRHALQLPSHDWLFLGSDEIYRLSADFEVQVKTGFAGQQLWYALFEADGNYWVAGENIASGGLLLRIDTSTLEVLATQNLGTNYRVKSLLHTPGDSLVWLSGNTNFSGNQTVFLKSAPENNPAIIPTRSLALTGIRLEATPKTYLDICGGLDGAQGRNYRIEFGKVYVTMKNTGPMPVQSFRVNGIFSRCSFICQGYEEISKPFDLPLLPGDSAELLLLTNFDLDGQYNVPQFNLCFWAAVPDDRLDLIPEDDRLCKTFSVLVSSPEPAAGAPSIRVFPNPSSGDVHFGFEQELAPCVLRLTDLPGRLMREEHLEGATHRLTRNGLPAGIYFYEIRNGQRRLASGRVVLTD